MRLLPAEWEPQSGVQLTWPDDQTDWSDILAEVIPVYQQVAKEIARREKLLIVCRNKALVLKYLTDVNLENVIFRECEMNDTWARDHGPITVFEEGQPVLCDFKFNGWGLKFASDKDNLITRYLYESSVFSAHTSYKNLLNCVLEGGGIESDGQGTILTTSECLLSPNRNGQWSRQEVEDYLKETLGATRILWVNNGYLAGDDTDSHIDTLARLATPNTILYVKCEDGRDEHYEQLQRMEEDLKAFRTVDGNPYQLVALPMADTVMDGDDRLPATYANFLIINGAVLVPTYGSDKDQVALDIIKQVFPDREIVGINCVPLIKQHGSLHCITMQFPQGVIL